MRFVTVHVPTSKETDQVKRGPALAGEARPLTGRVIDRVRALLLQDPPSAERRAPCNLLRCLPGRPSSVDRPVAHAR